MSGIHLDHEEAARVLARLLTESEEQRLLHHRSQPALPVAAAGRDFAGRGAAIAAMLQRVHGTGSSLIDALSSTTAAASTQVAAFRDVDRQLADELGGQHR